MTSSAIEGEKLDTDEVRSSIARRLGIPLQNDKPVGHDVEGIVEMMLDATQNFDQALTAERLFDWAEKYTQMLAQVCNDEIIPVINMATLT